MFLVVYTKAISQQFLYVWLIIYLINTLLVILPIWSSNDTSTGWMTNTHVYMCISLYHKYDISEDTNNKLRNTRWKLCVTQVYWTFNQRTTYRPLNKHSQNYYTHHATNEYLKQLIFSSQDLLQVSTNTFHKHMYIYANKTTYWNNSTLNTRIALDLYPEIPNQTQTAWS